MNLFLSKNITFFLYILLAVVYISGLFIPLMEFDSAQHATMAMRMYLKNDFIHLFRGFDEYLDKPHMHFWLSALSFKIFGLTDWAYRLPALFFTAIGAFSTYKLAEEFYGSKAGHIASIIFLSSQAIILANHDVRTDAVLTGASIFAIWQLVKYINHKKLINVILGAIGTGIAFSTKGQLAIFFIGSTLLCYVLYNRKWQSIFNWKVVVGIGAFLITCIPILYAYYYQFDMFPDKVVNGQTNVSGIKFIFWDQSFNRLTGSGFEGDNTDYFFFFHTLLWAFLPWAFMAYIAIFDRTRQFIKVKFKYQSNLEFLTVGGFWLIMLIINMSKSKLPHYMNSLLPVLAVLVSGYLVFLLDNSKIKMLKIILGIQYFVVIVGSILAIILITVVFPLPNILLIISYILLFILLIYALFKNQEIGSKIVVISVLFAVFVNFSLNTQFYPNLLKYQAGSSIAKIIEKEGIDVNNVAILDKEYSWSLNFYTQRETPGITVSKLKNSEGKWLFIYERDMDKLKEHNIEWQKSYEVPYFRITRLSLSFLNPKTRNETLKKAYLLQIK